MNRLSRRAVTAFVGVTSVGLVILAFAHRDGWTLGSWVALVSLIAVAFFTSVSAHAYSPLLRTAWRTVHESTMFGPLLSYLFLGVYSIALTRPQPGQWLDSPGAVFSIGVAGVTLVAFLFAVSRLDEIHGRILDYSHLLERLTQMLETENASVKTGRPGRLLMFGNFPAIGSISAPEQYYPFVRELKNLISNCASVKAAFLESPAMAEFVSNNFGAADLKDREHKLGESTEVIDQLKLRARRKPDSTDLRFFKSYIHEAPFQVFMTSGRMILVVTLNYPPGMNAGPSRTDQPASVHVIGVETGDQTLIRETERNIAARLDVIADRWRQGNESV